jgi:hypothetical protein
MPTGKRGAHRSLVWRTAAVLAVLLAQAPAEAAPKAEWKDAFSQDSLQLGTPLNVFRSMRNPDNETAGPVCSDSPRSNDTDYVEAHLSDAGLLKAGVVKCVFFMRSSFNVRLSLGLRIGGEMAATEFYFINPDNQREKYLFLIYSKGSSRKFSSLLPALENVYGQPRLSTEPWQTKTGDKRENQVATWQNSVSEIEFKQLGLSRDFFSLRFTLSSLMAILNARLGEPSGDQAKKQ